MNPKSKSNSINPHIVLKSSIVLLNSSEFIHIHADFNDPARVLLSRTQNAQRTEKNIIIIHKQTTKEEEEFKINK